MFRRRDRREKERKEEEEEEPAETKLVQDEDDGGVRRPPVEMKNYPPPILPKIAKGQEVSFYLPKESEGGGDDENNNDGGDELACSLIRCSDPKCASTQTKVETGGFTVDSSKPVIIVCHGTQSWRNQMLLAYLAFRLSESLHCHTLRFDFTGNGHSNGKWRYGNFQGEHEDLEQVVRFVRDQMKCRVLCVIGHSKGAQAVLKLAVHEEEREDRIPLYVLLAGRFSLPDRLGEGEQLSDDQVAELERRGVATIVSPLGVSFPMTWEDLEEKVELDSSESAEAKSARVLVLHGDADTVVPVGDARRFEETLEHCEVIILENADHNFNGLKYMPRLVESITAFVEKHA